MWSIGVDTGGTFTDLVAINTDGSIKRIKVPSTPSDPASAVFEALSRENFLEESSVDNIVIGTTIATNALLQRKGAKTLFITTKGFEDILFIQRIDRKGLYDLQWVKPKPYVERKHCIGVEERILSDGSILKEITTEELKKLEKVVKEKLNEFDKENLPTIAISLLFSYVNNKNEKKVTDFLISKFPNLDISASYDVAPIWREYERGNTTTMDAYVKPIVSKFSKSLNDGLEEKNFSGRASLMKSNGGQVPLNISAKRPVEMVLSGLASGIISGAYYSKSVGSKKAVTLDMGGTSADVGVVLDGETTFSGLFEVEWGL
ncbi:MAG: hydantoinase/oxoprolinase family protein, partial [Candidatus Actinomarinales bacterium]